MTTIVYRKLPNGYELAADGRIVRGDEIVSDNAIKIFKWKHGWFAGAGKTENIEAARQWLNQGQDEAGKPKLKSFNSIVIEDDDEGSYCPYMMDENLVMLPIEDDYYATGVGWVPALAALMCGKTAKEAVQIASKISACTGGKIKVVRVVE